MGVKTLITLDELNRLFPSYEFTAMVGTTSGIIDTTYIVSTCAVSDSEEVLLGWQDAYILKKYERDISEKVAQDRALLEELQAFGLNVPKCIGSAEGWYLYEKLQGTQPSNIKSFHIQALARFLAKLHQHTRKKNSAQSVIEKTEIASHLNYAKTNFFFYYKKLQFLSLDMCRETCRGNALGVPRNEGLIHGDIFKDNTIFNGTQIGVFDFIDSACGNFAFDAGVALVGFDAKRHGSYFVNLFLRTYNQHAPRKLSQAELLDSIETACGFYALKRIANFKNTKTAKEILR